MCASEFKSHWQNIIVSSMWKVFDKSMLAYCPWTIMTGGLPNLSFILRKPEPLGKYSLHVCFQFCLFTILFLTTVHYSSLIHLRY